MTGAALAKDHAPVFSYKDERGNIVTPDLESAKLTAVHFWATWCGPCIKELPQVDAAQFNHKEEGFNVIPIALEKDVEKVKQYFSGHRIISLTPYIDNERASVRAFGIQGLPVTIFLDSNGKEIGRSNGAMAWDSEENKAFLAHHLQ